MQPKNDGSRSSSSDGWKWGLGFGIAGLVLGAIAAFFFGKRKGSASLSSSAEDGGMQMNPRAQTGASTSAAATSESEAGGGSEDYQTRPSSMASRPAAPLPVTGGPADRNEPTYDIADGEEGRRATQTATVGANGNGRHVANPMYGGAAAADGSDRYASLGTRDGEAAESSA